MYLHLHKTVSSWCYVVEWAPFRCTRDSVYWASQAPLNPVISFCLVIENLWKICPSKPSRPMEGVVVSTFSLTFPHFAVHSATLTRSSQLDGRCTSSCAKPGKPNCHGKNDKRFQAKARIDKCIRYKYSYLIFCWESLEVQFKIQGRSGDSQNTLTIIASYHSTLHKSDKETVLRAFSAAPCWPSVRSSRSCTVKNSKFGSLDKTRRPKDASNDHRPAVRCVIFSSEGQIWILQTIATQLWLLCSKLHNSCQLFPRPPAGGLVVHQTDLLPRRWIIPASPQLRTKNTSLPWSTPWSTTSGQSFLPIPHPFPRAAPPGGLRGRQAGEGGINVACLEVLLGKCLAESLKISRETTNPTTQPGLVASPFPAWTNVRP